MLMHLSVTVGYNIAITFATDIAARASTLAHNDGMERSEGGVARRLRKRSLGPRFTLNDPATCCV